MTGSPGTKNKGYLVTLYIVRMQREVSAGAQVAFLNSV